MALGSTMFSDWIEDADCATVVGLKDVEYTLLMTPYLFDGKGEAWHLKLVGLLARFAFITKASGLVQHHWAHWAAASGRHEVQ